MFKTTKGTYRCTSNDDGGYDVLVRTVPEGRVRARWVRIGAVQRAGPGHRWSTSDDSEEHRSKKAAMGELVRRWEEEPPEEELEAALSKQEEPGEDPAPRTPPGAPFRLGQLVQSTELGYTGRVSNVEQRRGRWRVSIPIRHPRGTFSNPARKFKAIGVACPQCEEGEGEPTAMIDDVDWYRCMACNHAFPVAQDEVPA